MPLVSDAAGQRSQVIPVQEEALAPQFPKLIRKGQAASNMSRSNPNRRIDAKRNLNHDSVRPRMNPPAALTPTETPSHRFRCSIAPMDLAWGQGLISSW